MYDTSVNQLNFEVRNMAEGGEVVFLTYLFIFQINQINQGVEASVLNKYVWDEHWYFGGCETLKPPTLNNSKGDIRTEDLLTYVR